MYVSGREIASLEEWTSFLDEILADPEYRIGFSWISDRRDQTQAPPAGYAQAMADRLRERSRKLGGARWAMVVNSTVAYGLGRLIEMSIEPSGIEMRVFDDYDEGLRWIRSKSGR